MKGSVRKPRPSRLYGEKVMYCDTLQLSRPYHGFGIKLDYYGNAADAERFARWLLRAAAWMRAEGRKK